MSVIVYLNKKSFLSIISMTYYIYHIQGVKIGCTSDLKTRMRDQGFNEYEILETHTDIYEASKRELELQEEYGYRVDDIPYHISVRNFNSAFLGKSHSEEAKRKISETLKNKPRVICPHCNKDGNVSNMKRYHFDNCKHKKRG